MGVFMLLSSGLTSGAIAFWPQWIFPVMALLVLAIAAVVATVVYFAIEKPAVNLGADVLHASQRTGRLTG